MAIYTNEHLTDLLNEQYEKVRKLEKENTRLDEENHKLAYSLSQSVPVESSLEQYDRIKELEKENAELKKTYARNIEAMTGQISNDLLSVIKKYPTALPYICELRKESERLEKELQSTREQLEKCEHSLMKVACFETHGENKYISHEQAYTGVANFARQYFKQKDEVKGE